ncbi:unnamed protein product [Enterobius vermicularis]|uniref:Structure-specific endonuclease subunit SLX1 homolog n=1 Tax=Enterobius vermicularis TaxID=51028 RepID=A0A158Q951_ENTVE|nr:unnamed protein product [Enterobius vermicularis]
MSIHGSPPPVDCELLDDCWNCPPEDGFFNMLSSQHSPENVTSVFPEDIPGPSAVDDKKRFTFSSSELSNDALAFRRQSLSQSATTSNDLNYISSTQIASIALRDNEGFGAVAGPEAKLTKLQKCQISSVQNEFFGVYCLISRSPNKYFKNRCYIGYTVDPNRRIRQHNAGKQFGGARKTDHRGPWDMVCIIHGFPNSISALRFEWAWQNPEKSRRLRALGLKKKSRESAFAFRLRIACHMLNSDPWRRLALTFRWLLPTEEMPFPSDIPPPKHIVVKHGLVEKTTTLLSQNADAYELIKPCAICLQRIMSIEQLLRCVSSKCNCHFHAVCLAKRGLEASGELSRYLFPVTVSCHLCKTVFCWGDLVRDQRALISAMSARKAQCESNFNPRLIPKLSSNAMGL